ncbi:unnamed protein product, partial [Choristocarpus tenellus]
SDFELQVPPDILVSDLKVRVRERTEVEEVSYAEPPSFLDWRCPISCRETKADHPKSTREIIQSPLCAMEDFLNVRWLQKGNALVVSIIPCRTTGLTAILYRLSTCCGGIPCHLECKNASLFKLGDLERRISIHQERGIAIRETYFLLFIVFFPDTYFY